LRNEDGRRSYLIVRGKNSKKSYHFNIPSHLKLDMKAVAECVGEKCEFEDPQVIRERYGLIIGGVPPCGQLLNLDTFFDESIQKLDTVAFNCGLPTESLVMKGKDLIAVVQPTFGRFSKS
jgi:nondiscriminating aspartyl-tRNA synthetase